MESEKLAIDLAADDETVIARVLQGDKDAYEIIMRRYNQRLFRIARTFITDEDEIEDVVQETYISAYEQLARFENRARFSTWLIRILINHALARVKKGRRFTSFTPGTLNDRDTLREIREPSQNNDTPAEELMNRELKQILEKAVDDLPEKYRAVYMMREVEGMSVAETSACLAITPTNVKVRTNRAKEMLRRSINSFYREGELFQFNLVRCDRIVRNVLHRIHHLEGFS